MEEKIFKEEREKNRLINFVPRAINKIGEYGSAMMRRGENQDKSGSVTPRAFFAKSGTVTPRGFFGKPGNVTPSRTSKARASFITSKSPLNQSGEHGEKLLDDVSNQD